MSRERLEQACADAQALLSQIAASPEGRYWPGVQQWLLQYGMPAPLPTPDVQTAVSHEAIDALLDDPTAPHVER